jgi:FKBP-type peptidyl-prolyl cis-trans isomerases 1
MKKLNILFAIACITLVSFVSCNNNTTKKPILSSQIDSLNYAFGLANGEGIREFYFNNDTTGAKLDMFLKGLNEGLEAKEDKGNTELTNVASQIGATLKQQQIDGLLGDTTLTVDYDLIRQGLINGIKKSDIQMTAAEAQVYLETTMQSLYEKRMEEQYMENKLAGEAFLAENATKQGVVVTESGLQYKIIKGGRGLKPDETSMVKVHYHGTLIDGTVFDSSVEMGRPMTFGVNQVITGWTEALQLMPVGSKWMLYIPQGLAYGIQDQGTIKPFSTLIFEVELLAIED